MPKAQHPLCTRLLLEHGYAFWRQITRILDASGSERDFVTVAHFDSSGGCDVGVTSVDLALANVRKFPSLRRPLRAIERGQKAEPNMLCLVHIILIDGTETTLRSIAVYPEGPHAIR